MSQNRHPRFTIVVPACDTAPWLPEMLRSVKNQSCPDFEALIAVEQSKDNSLEIAEKFAAEDARFSVVSLPRSGSAAASRNYGIRHAAGDYILFADGDDWLELDALEQLRQALERHGDPDLLLFAGREYYETDKGLEFAREIWNFFFRQTGLVMTGPEIVVNIGRIANHFTPLQLYSAAYLRKHELFQSEGILHEDSEWVPRSWYYARRGVALDTILYNYRRRRNSVTTACSVKLLHDVARVTRMRIEFFFSRELPEGVKQVWSNQYLSLLFWYFFHPAYSRRFSREVRLRGLEFVLGTPGSADSFRRLAAWATFPKRAAIPLILSAVRHGVWFPAECYFRFVYYPLVRYREWRH